MITARTDSRVFDARLARVMARRTQARTLAVRAQADTVVAFVEAHGPRDTNRFVRAVVQAGNTAGLRQRSLPTVRPSRNGRLIGEALRGAVRLSLRNVSIWATRVDRWAKMEELYRRTNRAHYKYFGKIIAEKKLAEKELRFHTKRLDAAVRELTQFESQDGFAGVAIGTWGVREDLKINTRAALRRNTQSAFVLRRGVVALRRNIQIETKLYGGSGRVTQTADASFVSLTNHEPHARLVDRNTRIMSRAVGHARSRAGARRVSKKVYEEAVAAGTSWTQRGAA